MRIKKQQPLTEILSKLRRNSVFALSLEDITKEVEIAGQDRCKMKLHDMLIEKP
jgi:hypothetical protein